MQFAQGAPERATVHRPLRALQALHATAERLDLRVGAADVDGAAGRGILEVRWRRAEDLCAQVRESELMVLAKLLKKAPRGVQRPELLRLRSQALSTGNAWNQEGSAWQFQGVYIELPRLLNNQLSGAASGASGADMSSRRDLMPQTLRLV